MQRPSRSDVSMVSTALLFGLALFVPTVTAAATTSPATSGTLSSAIIQVRNSANMNYYDGLVEAIRQTSIAAQVAGVIVALPVKAGDKVKEGQLLARIDARAAAQGNIASQAQTQAARASLDMARKDYERQQHLFDKHYISQAALERAQAQFQATSAQLAAQVAQAGITHIQSDFYTIRAPYTGVISELAITLGDMALPGKPLLTLYDPSGLRVRTAIPQSVLKNFSAGQTIRLELPALNSEQQRLSLPLQNLQILPALDADTHSAQVRVSLPKSDSKTGINAAPGMFARIWLPTQNTQASQLVGPVAAIVRRAEMTGMYVINEKNQPQLRQVRLGRTDNDLVEILSGVSAGERVALDPQAAAKAGWNQQ